MRCCLLKPPGQGIPGAASCSQSTLERCRPCWGSGQLPWLLQSHQEEDKSREKSSCTLSTPTPLSLSCSPWQVLVRMLNMPQPRQPFLHLYLDNFFTRLVYEDSPPSANSLTLLLLQPGRPVFLFYNYFSISPSRGPSSAARPQDRRVSCACMEHAFVCAQGDRGAGGMCSHPPQAALQHPAHPMAIPQSGPQHMLEITNVPGLANSCSPRARSKRMSQLNCKCCNPTACSAFEDQQPAGAISPCRNVMALFCRAGDNLVWGHSDLPPHTVLSHPTAVTSMFFVPPLLLK